MGPRQQLQLCVHGFPSPLLEDRYESYVLQASGGSKHYLQFSVVMSSVVLSQLAVQQWMGGVAEPSWPALALPMFFSAGYICTLLTLIYQPAFYASPGNRERLFIVCALCRILVKLAISLGWPSSAILNDALSGPGVDMFAGVMLQANFEQMRFTPSITLACLEMIAWRFYSAAVGYSPLLSFLRCLLRAMLTFVACVVKDAYSRHVFAKALLAASPVGSSGASSAGSGLHSKFNSALSLSKGSSASASLQLSMAALAHPTSSLSASHRDLQADTKADVGGAGSAAASSAPVMAKAHMFTPLPSSLQLKRSFDPWSSQNVDKGQAGGFQPTLPAELARHDGDAMAAAHEDAAQVCRPVSRKHISAGCSSSHKPSSATNSGDVNDSGRRSASNLSATDCTSRPAELPAAVAQPVSASSVLNLSHTAGVAAALRSGGASCKAAVPTALPTALTSSRPRISKAPRAHAAESPKRQRLKASSRLSLPTVPADGSEAVGQGHYRSSNVDEDIAAALEKPSTSSVAESIVDAASKVHTTSICGTAQSKPIDALQAPPLPAVQAEPAVMSSCLKACQATAATAAPVGGVTQQVLLDSSYDPWKATRDELTAITAVEPVVPLALLRPHLQTSVTAPADYAGSAGQRAGQRDAAFSKTASASVSTGGAYVDNVPAPFTAAPASTSSSSRQLLALPKQELSYDPWARPPPAALQDVVQPFVPSVFLTSTALRGVESTATAAAAPPDARQAQVPVATIAPATATGRHSPTVTWADCSTGPAAAGALSSPCCVCVAVRCDQADKDSDLGSSGDHSGGSDGASMRKAVPTDLQKTLSLDAHSEGRSSHSGSCRAQPTTSSSSLMPAVSALPVH